MAGSNYPGEPYRRGADDCNGVARPHAAPAHAVDRNRQGLDERSASPIDVVSHRKQPGRPARDVLGEAASGVGGLVGAVPGLALAAEPALATGKPPTNRLDHYAVAHREPGLALRHLDDLAGNLVA